ncbi:hypothetical protein SLEP1_g38975 [Rubroshorea leprosula]|uniref:Uncharacterized protein n=1 Tax=Rubroshorea leprosula TaxID=152421 RepID=A0AAV5KYU1_9ROSI|nr:hypothetical protein SLEP1_g38975 [Rubroshorea leprosula]
MIQILKISLKPVAHEEVEYPIYRNIVVIDQDLST